MKRISSRRDYLLRRFGSFGGDLHHGIQLASSICPQWSLPYTDIISDVVSQAKEPIMATLTHSLSDEELRVSAKA